MDWRTLQQWVAMRPFIFGWKHEDKQSSAVQAKREKQCCYRQNTQKTKTVDITSPCLILLLQHLESHRVFSLHPLCLIDSSPWTCVSLCLCVCIVKERKGERVSSARVYLCMWAVVSSYLLERKGMEEKPGAEEAGHSRGETERGREGDRERGHWRNPFVISVDCWDTGEGD